MSAFPVVAFGSQEVRGTVVTKLVPALIHVGLRSIVAGHNHQSVVREFQPIQLIHHPSYVMIHLHHEIAIDIQFALTDKSITGRVRCVRCIEWHVNEKGALLVALDEGDHLVGQGRHDVFMPPARNGRPLPATFVFFLQAGRGLPGNTVIPNENIGGHVQRCGNPEVLVESVDDGGVLNRFCEIDSLRIVTHVVAIRTAYSS